MSVAPPAGAALFPINRFWEYAIVKSLHPNLWTLAVRLLGSPATSAGAERGFSTAKGIESALRASMSLALSTATICVKYNTVKRGKLPPEPMSLAEVTSRVDSQPFLDEDCVDSVVIEVI